MRWLQLFFCKWTIQMTHYWPMTFDVQLLLDFERDDAASVSLKFEVRQLITPKKCSTPDMERYQEMSLWGTAHTTLDKILVTGSKGLELFLPLDFGVPENKYMVKQWRKVFPGNLLVRAEILQPCNYGVGACRVSISSNFMEFLRQKFCRFCSNLDFSLKNQRPIISSNFTN